MATIEKEPAPIEKYLDAFDEIVLYRYPHVVGPPFVASLVLGVAWAAHYFGGAWPTLLTITTAVVTFLGLESVPHLPGARERGYALACWASGTFWTIAAAWRGPFTGELPLIRGWFGWSLPPLIVAWLIILAAGWPPWTKHRRIRRAVDVSRVILAWDGDAVHLPRVKLSAAGAKADEDGWEAPLIPEIPGEYTTDKLEKALPNIAARFGAAVHELSIHKVRGDKEGKWMLRFRKARTKVPPEYRAVTERPTARGSFQIGHVSSDKTQPLMSEFWRKNHGGVDGLSCGMKGFGKTSYLKRMALHAIACEDGLLFLADFKPGSPDYRSIGRGAYIYCKVPAEADLMVQALLIICRVRGEHPRKDRKVILVEFDETYLYVTPTDKGTTSATKAAAANTDAQRAARFNSLVAISRSFDISIHCATQRGKDRNVGGDARSMLLAGQVCGFYSPKPADSALLSGDKEFNLASLPMGVPGECLITNGIHPEVTRGTLWHVTDAVEKEMLDRFAAKQGDLHPDELAALAAELGDAWGELRKANRKVPFVVDAEPVDLPDVEPVAEPSTRATTPEESRQLVWQALASLGRPASVSEIADAAGRSKPLTQVRLRELIAERRVITSGANRWTRYEAVHRASDQRGTGSPPSNTPQTTR